MANIFEPKKKDCPQCGQVFIVRTTRMKFCSDACTRRDRVDRNRQIMHDWKDSPCMDCGIKYNPWQMDFDHLPGEVKSGNVSQMLNTNTETLKEEMRKCDLVCANCHRDRSYRRLQGEPEWPL